MQSHCAPVIEWQATQLSAISPAGWSDATALCALAAASHMVQF